MRSIKMRPAIHKLTASLTFAGYEGLNQVLMLGVGLLVIRNMPTTDYGYYIICIAAVGLCNSLANSGLSSGFRKIGGEVHADKKKLSSLYVSAVRERRFQSLFVVPACVGIAGLVLWRQESDVTQAVVLSFLVGLNVIPDLWRAISVEVLLLKSAWRAVQCQNLMSAVLRMSMLLPLLFIGLNTTAMLLVNAVALWFVGWMTYRAAAQKLSFPAAEAPEQRREIRKIMNRVMPNAIFSAGQQQLGTFLLATRGSVVAVADLGALTRLTSIFSIGVNAVAQIVAPKFAKTHELVALRALYYGMLGLVAGIVACVLVITLLFPTQLLWMLGPNYAHLQAPLFLAACLVMLQFAKAVTARMNQAKAWISRTARWNIPLTLAAIGGGFFLCDTRTLEGVLTLMLLSGFPMLVLYLADASFGLRAASRGVAAQASKRGRF